MDNAGVTTYGPSEPLYQECSMCTHFVLPNTVQGENIPEYIHADGDVSTWHFATPSGRWATLATWKQYGPSEMRERLGENHQPSGLPLILARNLPEELLQVEGATDLLNIISSGYDSGDSWASAMSAGFALCEALYVLEADIPSELQYRPGAWDGTFSVDDIRTGGNGGDHNLTVELLQYMDQDTDKAVDQLTRLALAVDELTDRLRAEGKDY